MRTTKSFFFWQNVLEFGKPVNGIKGYTPILHLDGFDFIKGFVPEYMHSVCLGVIKQLIHLWVDTQHHEKMWYIPRPLLAIINSKLESTLPPNDVHRTGRGLDNLSFWTAAEFKFIALFYAPLFQNIVPEPYFSHFYSLSYGLHILLQDQVPVDLVLKVEILFRKFVRDMKDIYGEEHVTYNVHLMTHLPQSVIDWGCLWNTSTFIPEWFNSQLEQSSHGTQYVIDQMASRFLMGQQVYNDAMSMLKSTERRLPEQARRLLIDLLRLPEPVDESSYITFDSVSLLGKPEEKMDLNEEKKTALSHHLREEQSRVFKFFKKMKLNGTVYTTKDYDRALKRTNCYAVLNDACFIEIECFVLSKCESDGITLEPYQFFILARKLGARSKEVYLPPPVNETTDFPPITGITASLTGKGRLECISVKDVAKKCVAVLIDTESDRLILSALPNGFETD